MVDFDNVFKYCTPKYVYIRDAKLGMMKYTMMGLIFFYVIVYNILYTCDHLAPHHARGFGNIQMYHPVDDCDALDAECLAKWHNIGTLPYCTQYVEKKGDEAASQRRMAETDSEEDGKDAAESDVGKYLSPQKKCRYLDNRRLEWESGVPSELFIPTHYKQIRQDLNPDCYNPEIHTTEELKGGSKYRCKSGWITKDVKHFWVADIEQFTLRMGHSFSAPIIGKFGVSTDFQGIFAACKTNHVTSISAECKRAKVPHTSGAIASEDEEGLMTAEEMEIPSLKGGPSGRDEISLGDFLKVTPVAQNHPSVRENVLDTELPADLGHPGKSLRDVGGMLLIDVNYDNMGYSRPGIPGLPEPYQVKPITYTYRPYFIPTTENMKYQLVEQSDHSKSRIVDIWYGVTVKMQFNGQLVVFSWSKLLTAMTTGLVLLSMATTLVCYAASFVLPMQEKYNALMYQMSEDMSNFGNMRNKKVKGLGQWINPVGLLSDTAWAAEETVFSTGTSLLSKLGSDGTPTQELTNEEVITILCVNEMRMNRLDGMDVRMIFADPEADQTKNNKAYKLIKKTEDGFYSKFQ